MGIALVPVVTSGACGQSAVAVAVAQWTVGGKGGPAPRWLEREMHAFTARSSVENLRQEPVAVRPTQKRTHTHLSAKPTNKRNNNPPAAPHGLNPSTMFSALLLLMLRPLALALSVSLAALAVDARQDTLCQSASACRAGTSAPSSGISPDCPFHTRHFLCHILRSPRCINRPGRSSSPPTSSPAHKLALTDC